VDMFEPDETNEPITSDTGKVPNYLRFVSLLIDTSTARRERPRPSVNQCPGYSDWKDI